MQFVQNRDVAPWIIQSVATFYLAFQRADRRRSIVVSDRTLVTLAVYSSRFMLLVVVYTIAKPGLKTGISHED